MPPTATHNQAALMKQAESGSSRPAVSFSNASRHPSLSPLADAGDRDTSLRQPPSKRRRVALACSNCRSRKSRCDGARPKCSMCQELDCECLYQHVGSSPNLTVGKEYVAQLEYRVEQIEEFIRHLRESGLTILSENDLPPQQSLRGSTQHDHHTVETRRQEPRSQLSNAVGASNSEMGELDTSENAIDGMGAINFTDEEDSGFFGPSSNIAFMRHISHAISQAKSMNPYLPPVSPRQRYETSMMNTSRSLSTSHSNLRRSRSNQVNIYALPSESRTWLLIQKYFSKTGQLLPFIHEESFCETYFEMKRTNFTRVRRTWLGLLNIVLAIATSLATDSEFAAQKRIDESDVYYQRANALCDRESKRNTSLEMVQYLLILGQYLQGTQKSVQAWNTHGLAITAAFQIGLHSPEANREYSPLEREIRKRTWFGCILLDRTLSMTFGRPCIIPQSYVKLDMPLPDTPMLHRHSQVEIARQHDGIFFTAAIQLYVVLYNVIDVCYGQNLGFENSRTLVQVFTDVLEGDRQLEEWQHELLPKLGFKIPNRPLLPSDIENMRPDDLISQRFNVVLCLRYHNLRILLHRQFLEWFLKNFDHGNVSSSDRKVIQQTGGTSVQNCVESASMIIGTVHTIVSSNGWQKDLLGAWNYSLYYTFNAGLVIFAAILVSSKERVHNPALWKVVDQSRLYLDMAIEALHVLDSGNRVIERCLEYLRQLLLAMNALMPEELARHADSATHAWKKSSVVAGVDPIAAPSMFQPSLSENHNEINTYSLRNLNGSHNSNVDSQDQPSLGVDLGEFMVDSDLDFLSRLFDIGPTGSHNVDHRGPNTGEDTVSAREG